MKDSLIRGRLLLLAALCTLSVSGCKKQEQVDVSSLHTATAAKETLAEEPEEAASAPIETESQSAQNHTGLTTGQKQETIGKAVFSYPVLSQMKDAAREEAVNALIRSNAAFIASIHADQEIQIEAAVESLNLRRITILYTGETSEGDRLFFTNTIDLETAQNLGLRDFADPYTVAGYLDSGEYKLLDPAGDEAAIRRYLKQTSLEEYYTRFKEADFGRREAETEEQTLPSLFSYEKQGVIYVALPLPRELGSYILIPYSPDNK